MGLAHPAGRGTIWAGAPAGRRDAGDRRAIWAMRSAKAQAGRWALLGVLLAGAAAAFWVAGDRLTIDGTARQLRSRWRAGATRHLALAVAAFAAAYIAAVAFSVPGAVWLTLVGGFLFGVAAGAALVIVSATIGATLLFLAARTVLAAPLRGAAGGWVGRLERGFRRGEVSFLLVMRLVPAVPFFVANLAPAFLGARPWTFVWTTFVGIIPGTLVYISIGAGLGEQLERGERPDLGVIFQPYVLGPLLGLAALAALPLVLRWSGGHVGRWRRPGRMSVLTPRPLRHRRRLRRPVGRRRRGADGRQRRAGRGGPHGRRLPERRAACRRSR